MLKPGPVLKPAMLMVTPQKLANKRGERGWHPLPLSQAHKKLKADTENVCVPAQPPKKRKTDPEKVCVPAQPVQSPKQAGVSIDAPPQAQASASTRSHDGIAKPWGVETPQVMPPLPGDDASPTQADVLKLVKRVAAYVVTTLPTFFKNHRRIQSFGFRCRGRQEPKRLRRIDVVTSAGLSVLILCESVQ